MTREQTPSFTKRDEKNYTKGVPKNMFSGTSYRFLSPIRTTSYNFYKSRFFIVRYFEEKKRSLDQDTIGCNTVDTKHRRNSTLRSWKINVTATWSLMRAMGRNDVRGRSDLYRRLVRTGRCGMVDRYPLEGVEVGGWGWGWGWVPSSHTSTRNACWALVSRRSSNVMVAYM